MKWQNSILSRGRGYLDSFLKESIILRFIDDDDFVGGYHHLKSYRENVKNEEVRGC
jgi:hypothetical protein